MSVQIQQNEQRAYDSILSDLRDIAENADDGSFPVRLTTAADDEFSDEEFGVDFYLGILTLSHKGPTDNTSYQSHWRSVCNDETDPTEVLRSLAVSAAVADALAHS